MKNLFDFLEFKISTPTNYGWFHLLFMAIIIAVTVFICLKFKDCDQKTFKKITFFCWLIMFVFEIYKQFVFTFDYTDGKIVSDYSWYSFPFQLCSTPLYVLPFIAFMKESKIRDALCSYISTFALFGGLVVFFYPNDVFIDILGIDIQTMIHHGLQIVTGIFFAVYNRKKLTIKYFLSSVPVFIFLLLIAVLLNEVVHGALISAGKTDDFSMFYISPYVPNHLPLLSLVYSAVDWIIFVLAYVLGFTLASLIVFYAIVGGVKLFTKISNKYFSSHA